MDGGGNELSYLDEDLIELSAIEPVLVPTSEPTPGSSHHIDAPHASKHPPTSTPRKSKRQDKKYLCGECGAELKTYSGLSRHEKSHKKIFLKTCEICGKGFFNEAAFKDHIQGHHGIKEHRCQTCTKHFSTKSNLTRHLRSGNCSESPQRVDCNECGKSLKNDRSLKEHVASMHSSTQRYKCVNCHRPFKHRSGLALHKEKCVAENI